MPKFRKRSVEIEAREFESFNDVPSLLEWIGKERAWYDGVHVVIGTLEGNVRATLGDWIIRGVRGEFYPCKPDIFAATYDPA